jgi:predicted regulator of Ras-like GTPase activity (Roadblock/LC7/MglB family)
LPGIEDTLRSLRDVQGVYGSFVVAGSGALVARDLPAVFDGELFAEVGPRVTRLYETFLTGGEELDSAMLRFAEHKLYLRKMSWGVIGVLSTVAVNLPALRMVANLVIRKIDPEVTPSMLTPPPPLAEIPVPLSTRSAEPPPRPATRPPPVRTSTPSPPPILPAAILPEPPTEPGPSSKHVRMYRGRPVVDD